MTPGARIAAAIDILSALEAGDRTTDQIIARIYHDVDRALWPFAAFSVRAALQYLNDQGQLPPGVMQQRDES